MYHKRFNKDLATNILCIAFLLLFAQTANGQFQKKTMTTDSSEIEIIKNSVYKIYEETYIDTDSVWYSVKFIDDTTQVHKEGWKTKEGENATY